MFDLDRPNNEVPVEPNDLLARGFEDPEPGPASSDGEDKGEEDRPVGEVVGAPEGGGGGDEGEGLFIFCFGWKRGTRVDIKYSVYQLLGRAWTCQECRRKFRGSSLGGVECDESDTSWSGTISGDGEGDGEGVGEGDGDGDGDVVDDVVIDGYREDGGDGSGVGGNDLKRIERRSRLA